MYKALLATFISSAAAVNAFNEQNLAQTSASPSLSFAQVEAMTTEQMQVVLDLSGDWIDAYSKVIEEHKMSVAERAWTAMENDGRAPLLEVCDKGDKCRKEVQERTLATIDSEWRKVIETLKASIVSATSQTKEILEQGWTKKEQCEKDFPCCTYGKEWQHNVKDMMITARAKMISHYEMWQEKENKRLELLDECCPPNYIGEQVLIAGECNTCADLSPCWDGSARNEDDRCSCPAFVAPACPETTCADGSPVDENCGCNVPEPESESDDEPTGHHHSHFIFPGDGLTYKYAEVCKMNQDATFDVDDWEMATGAITLGEKKRVKNENEWVLDLEKPGIRCCYLKTKKGDTFVEGLSTAGDCHSGTWDEAYDFCAANDARLCTIDELSQGLANNAGCGHNYTLVWTADECGE